MTASKTTLQTSETNSLQALPPVGSLLEGEPVFLVVGKLRRPHGVQGEMVMEIFTDFPERLRSGVWVYVGEEHKRLRIRKRRPNNDTLLVAFDEITTPEGAGELRNQFVYVRADDRPPLPDGEYYHHELLGLDVVSEDGQQLGKLVEILSSTANDVYIVRPETGREVLLPALKSVILDVNLKESQMRVHLLPGLLPE
jgi:16S rRNA processing protein RimM